MFKKYITIIVIGIFSCLGLWWYVRAQGGSDQEPSPLERLTKIESKLDTFAMTQENANRETAKKLDQVLRNQDAILKELEVVKIRATR
jgi:hypothetical protein